MVRQQLLRIGFELYRGRLRVSLTSRPGIAGLDQYFSTVALLNCRLDDSFLRKGGRYLVYYGMLNNIPSFYIVDTGTILTGVTTKNSSQHC